MSTESSFSNRSSRFIRLKYGFPRDARIRKAREYHAIYREGFHVNVGPLQVIVTGGKSGRSRLGLVVSRKVGKSVYRNRTKRLIRESFRCLQNEFPEIYDVVVSVRPHKELYELADFKRYLFEAILEVHERRQGQRLEDKK